MTLAPSDVSPTARRRHAATIYVGGDESTTLRGLLRQAGVPCATLGDLADIEALDERTAVVIVTASGVRPESSLARANEACLARGITWLPVGPVEPLASGYEVRVGPLIVPGTSACLDCGLAQNADTLEYRAGGYRELEGRRRVVVPDALNQHRLALAYLIVSRWVALRDPRLPGRVFTITHGQPEIHHAWTARNPSCRTC